MVLTGLPFWIEGEAVASPIGRTSDGRSVVRPIRAVEVFERVGIGVRLPPEISDLAELREHPVPDAHCCTLIGLASSLSGWSVAKNWTPRIWMRAFVATSKKNQASHPALAPPPP